MRSHGLKVRVTTSGGHATFRLPINLRNVQNQDLTLCAWGLFGGEVTIYIPDNGRSRPVALPPDGDTVAMDQAGESGG